MFSPSANPVGATRPPIWARLAALALAAVAAGRGSGSTPETSHPSDRRTRAGGSAAGGRVQGKGGDGGTSASADAAARAETKSDPATTHERAQETDRGREAESPHQIPWRGWKDIVWRFIEEAGKDRLLAIAAGVVFYGLLSIFPAITALVSSYGLFADPKTIGDHLSAAAGIMPAEAFELLRQQVLRIAGNGGGKLTLGFVAGLAVALWSANAGMKAIFDALNVIYNEEEKRSFLKLNAISLTFTILAVVAMLLALAAVVVFPVVLAGLGIKSLNATLVSLIRWPLLFGLIVVGLAVLYRYGPSREKAEWRWLTPGSLFAAFAWIAGSLAFSHYLQNFADYNATYGSLGAVIGLMMWMWMSAIVVLAGAELNSEIEHQTAHDSTEGGDKPLGSRGAAVADTIGQARA